MSVIVSVIGAKTDTEEYRSALKMKKILQDGLPQKAIGEVILHANATLMGQTIKDIDLLMMGTIQNFYLPLSFTNADNEIINDQIEINSFCTSIEIKSHDINGISREGTEFYVKYGIDKHSVTYQSNEQKISVMNFFKRAFGGYSPFITNVIWFTGATQQDIRNLLCIGSKMMPSNVLGNNFSISELFQLIVWQRKPKLYRNEYHFDSNFEGQTLSELRNVFTLFAKSKQSMGELTRSRIEQITSNSVRPSIASNPEGRMMIYRGRAGTGKTVSLIRSAINYVCEQEARVLILTYNKALVSDIRRLFALAELPDMFQTSCVSINTMQSYFFRLVNLGLYNGGLPVKNYLDNYDQYISELRDFLLSDLEAKDMLFEVVHKDVHLKWDYCFVDEAQDWTGKERDLLLTLFPNENIIVADGGRQFVRDVEGCDWTIVENRKNVKFKCCLRQKNNIIKFLNHYLSEMGVQDQRIIPSDRLPGGKVVIYQNPDHPFALINSEMKLLKDAGNIAYDMLIFVPHIYVEKDPRGFKFKASYEKQGLVIWDGTNDGIRDTYSINGDEIRVLQYDSGRGLEAWTVFCLEFDTFVDEKLMQYDERKFFDNLTLESEADRKLKYLMNWILIPLTRAIDTLVITLRDPDSETSKLLRKIAFEYPDYINFYIKEH